MHNREYNVDRKEKYTASKKLMKSKMSLLPTFAANQSGEFHIKAGEFLVITRAEMNTPFHKGWQIVHPPGSLGIRYQVIASSKQLYKLIDSKF